jgi:hypothetical protein
LDPPSREWRKMALATARDSNVNFTPFWGNKIDGLSRSQKLLKRSSTLGGGVDGRFYAAKGGTPVNPIGVYFAFRGRAIRVVARADLNSRRRRSLPRGDGPPPSFGAIETPSSLKLTVFPSSLFSAL